MKNQQNVVTKYISNFLGIIFFCCIVLALVSLGTFLYAPRTGDTSREQAADRISRAEDAAAQTDHFHIIDQPAYTRSVDPSMCLQCHGNFCHNESPELRSFYNMHTFSLACETCHIRQNEGERFAFKWFSLAGAGEVARPRGTQVSHTAKIIPLRAGTRLDAFPEVELARTYLQRGDSYTDDEKKAVLKKLMGHLSPEALTCKECHRTPGYLDFGLLGYSQEDIRNLVQLEIVKLMDDNRKFFIPTMFDPARAGQTGKN